jgi:N-acetylmuramoyl-L-alanine amidase/LysM repeat protein
VQIVERPLLEKPATVKAPLEKPLPTVASGAAARPLASGPAESTVLATTPPPEKAAEKPLQDKAPAEKPLVDKSLRRGRNIIIAIDAGHGGEDPGAIGLHGSYEKNVTLAIARELAALFKAAPGITPVLTRDGDYFIPLQDRRQIARYKDHADIFISIHADSAPARAAKGASVFALSLKGANTATSRFARMLAERENRADLIGGVAIQKDDEDSVLRNVLADMVVTGSLEHSLRMGRNILEGLDHVGELHSEQVEQAGFAVLKEPGMVSLLVETGFISNPDEEKRLTSKPHQREIAKAVFDGALRYCQQYPAPGSYFAWLYDKNRAEKDALAARADGKAASKADSKTDTRADAKVDGRDERLASNDSKPAADSRPRVITHRIMNGDSLKAIALRYQTTPKSIKELNGLDDDTVRVGQILKVPAN